MKIGVAVPTFANPGVPYFRTPNWEQLGRAPVAESVRLAEELSYHSAWVGDHMFLGRDGAILEGWTTLCWIAGSTSRIRLGPIHLGNMFRHAPLQAKMAATLDWLSNGRLEWFVDPAWRAREHLEYGFDWQPDRARRAQQLSEAIDLTRLLWTGEPITYQGDFYELTDAVCRPTPVQEGGPRLWLGEALDEASLKLIATQADVWNSIPAGESLLVEKLDKVDQACRRYGRDPATLSRSLETQVLIVESEAELEAHFARYARLREQYPSGAAMSDVLAFLREVNPSLDSMVGADDFRDEFVMGTSQQVLEKLRRYRDMGIDEVICWFMDFPGTDSMRRLALDVRPELDRERTTHA